MLARTHVLVFSTLVISTCGCYLDKDNWARCSTFGELSKEGSNSWYSLYLTGDSAQTYGGTDEESFMNVKGIGNLLASRILNDIQPGTFKDLPKLNWVKLSENKINTLKAGSFENPSLEVLTVENCVVWEIEKDFLRNMPKIRQFWLTGNNIPYIRSGTFKNDNLQQFSLADNNIQFVETGAFESLPKLSYILLHSNRLTTVSRELFMGMRNLVFVLLHLNVIETIEDESFVDLDSMTNLDISNNRIQELPSTLFQKSGSKLYWLFIHNNLLTYLSPGLLSRLGALGKVSMAGNPWQCQCLNPLLAHFQEKSVQSICDQDITNGLRPSCVSPEGYGACTYDITYREEIIKHYEKIIRSYPQLPPICQTRNRTEAVLEPVNQ